MTLRAVGLLSLALELLWCLAPIHALDELVNKKAGDVLGQLTRHSRAIACTNGGSFESINAVSADGMHTTGLTICCTAGSTVWWEGLQDPGPQCADFGQLGGGATTTASCAPQSAVQAIHFDGDRDVNALQGLPWAQFCDTDKCGIMAGALAVGCYNPANAQSQPVQQPLLDKLDCPADQVVEAIYAHWNELSIQSLDAVTCRPAYTAVAPNDPIFTTGCESGGDAATPVDLRCHGATSDVCGCIKVPAISAQPYFGCVMSGYTAGDSMPLVTLPGVVDAVPQPDCQAPDRMKRFLPRDVWPRMEDEEGNCLTANSPEQAAWDACVDDTLLPSQGWRLIAFQADQGIDALESLKFPGSCAVLDAGLEISLCSCSQVALSVANKAIVFGAGGEVQEPEDAIAPEEPDEDEVEPPELIEPAAVATPEEPPGDYAEEPEADPAVEPPEDAEPEELVPVEDYEAIPPEEVPEEPVEEEVVAEPPVDAEDDVAAEPPVTPPEEAPPAEDDANDDALAPGDARRRSLLELPPGECPTGAVASWQQTYNKKTVNPHSQFKIYQAAESLVNAVKEGGGLPTATLLGAPEFGVIKSLDVGEEFDPVRVCSWRQVVCGPDVILQVSFVGGAGTIPAEITNVQGLKGIAVVGEGGTDGAAPAPALELQGKAQVVALHVQSTSLTGRLPCSWGADGLMYLGVVGNQDLSGPLPTCFSQVSPDIMINISENDPQNPFCGSRSPENPIAKQIPKCSNIDSVPKFPGTPVSLTLDKNEECSDVAPKFQKFVETKMGFMMDVTDVSCPGAAVNPGSGRRLLQAGPITLNTDLAGPLADSTLKQALTADDPGQLFNALQEDVGEVSAVSVDAPDLPQDDSIATLAPGADPVDVDGGGSGSSRNLLSIILIVCVAAAVLLFVIVGALFCRARARKRQQQEVGSLKPNTAATYVSVDASITQNSADFSGAVPPPDPIMAVKPPQQLQGRNSIENRNPSFGAPVVAPAPNMVPVPGIPFKGPETAKSSAWGTHTQAFAASSAFPDSDLPTAAPRRSAINADTPTNGGVVSTMPRPPLSATSNDMASNVSPGEGGAGYAVAPMPQSSDEIDESEMLNTGGDGSMISRSLSKVRTSGNARRGGKEVTPTLPSSANNYPHSEELAKMSSREIHRRMRSPEVSGSRRAKAGDDSESATPGTGGGPSSSKNATNTPTSKPKSEEQAERPANPAAPAAVAERPAMGYLAAAVAGTGAAAGTAAVANPRSSNPSPPTSVGPGADAAAEAARLREAYAANNFFNPEAKSDHPVSVETMEEKNGIQLKAAKRRVGAVGGVSEPASPDDFSMRVGNTFLMGFTGDLSQSQADVDGGMSQTVKGGGGETGEVDSPDSKGGVSVSSFKSVSVMSESTTVYTDIGNKDTEGDAMTKLEQVLNRVQRELGGQVGSFRLKGIRHRFTGRSSLVAFADGMWGGEFALKFYSDVEAAQTEFAIYRQAEDLHMALPPVQEIEDNTGGVLRLKDGTPLPPYLAMPRGLPLPDWYAMHRPRQVATLAMLAQLVYRLEKLHVSGYCHNDIKPANMVLLDGGKTKKPEWHIVDFTNMSQIGSNTRARYTLEYASPEVIRAVGAMRAHYVTCQPSMDVWSMGVICFEVLTSKPFFPMDYNREAMKDGLIGLEPLPVEEEPALFSKIPAEGKLRATVKMMLSRDTEKRPSAAAIGKAISDCLKELTGEAPEPLDASPVSSLMREDSTTGI